MLFIGICLKCCCKIIYNSEFNIVFRINPFITIMIFTKYYFLGFCKAFKENSYDLPLLAPYYWTPFTNMEWFSDVYI